MQKTGMFQDEIGETSCKICEAGTYQNLMGQDNCKLCPADRYCPLNSTIPEICPKGTFLSPNCDFEGSTDFPSNLMDIYIVNNYICTATSKDECQNCPVGHFCPFLTKVPVKCETGMVQDEIGKTVCRICEAGTYQNKTGQNQCEECPE